MMRSFRNRQPTIGQDTYVSEYATLVGDVQIGDNCYIGHGAILRGDYGSIAIGNGTAVEEGVIMHAPPGETCQVGEKVTIGHGAIVHSGRIGNMAVVGMGAVLSIGAEIGDESIVAEGAIVKMGQIIPPRVVAGGNPARVFRAVEDRDRDFWGWGKQLYVDLAKEYIQEETRTQT